VRKNFVRRNSVARGRCAGSSDVPGTMNVLVGGRIPKVGDVKAAAEAANKKKEKSFIIMID